MLSCLTLLLSTVATAVPVDRALERVLAVPELHGAMISVVVHDAEGRVVAVRQPTTRTVPASTVKWLTAVAAPAPTDGSA